MPYEIIRLKNRHVQVRNKDTGQIKVKDNDQESEETNKTSAMEGTC